MDKQELLYCRNLRGFEVLLTRNEGVLQWNLSSEVGSYTNTNKKGGNVIRMAEISVEERFKMVVPRLFGLVGTIAKGVDKKFGAEGRKLLAEIMGGRGSELGKRLKPQCPAEDFKTVGMLYANTLRTMYGLEFKTEAKDSEFVFHWPKCAFGLEGTSRELCEAMMTQVSKAIETLGPELTLEIRKTVAVGDPECVVVIKPKG